MADGSGETFGEPVGSESEQVSADTMQPEELSLVMECYRREPVRFVRPPAVYEQALKCGWVMDGPSDLFVVREQGSFRGYMIVPRASGDDRARIAEFAGDRRSLLAAIPLILRQRSLRSILVHVQRHDILLQSLFEQRGLKGATVASPGTVTLIDFPGLMECLRPWFVERVGTRVVAQLQWDQAGEKVWIRLGADEIVAGRAETARMLFGSAEEEWSPLLLPESALCDMLKAALPLPSLWYGINYV